MASDPREKNACMDAISTDVSIGIRLKFHHEEKQLCSIRPTEESQGSLIFYCPHTHTYTHTHTAKHNLVERNDCHHNQKDK